jgi:hypothetical protein
MTLDSLVLGGRRRGYEDAGMTRDGTRGLFCTVLRVAIADFHNFCIGFGAGYGFTLMAYAVRYCLNHKRYLGVGICSPILFEPSPLNVLADKLDRDCLAGRFCWA